MNQVKKYLGALREIFLSTIGKVFLLADSLVFCLSLFSKSINIPVFVYWVILIFGFLLSSLQLIVSKNSQIRKLNIKKKTDNKIYKLEQQDIENQFTEKIIKAREQFARRGISGSGIEKRKIGAIEAQKKRELEKLKLKYGKHADKPLEKS